MDHTLFGIAVEDLFIHTAARHGVKAYRPEGILPYDLVVKSKEGPITVQVKGTRTLRRHKYDLFGRVRMTRHTIANRHYADAGVDYFAAYVVFWDLWYIFPLRGRTSAYVELRRNPTGPLKGSVNNWGAFKTSVV